MYMYKCGIGAASPTPHPYFTSFAPLDYGAARYVRDHSDGIGLWDTDRAKRVRASEDVLRIHSLADITHHCVKKRVLTDRQTSLPTTTSLPCLRISGLFSPLISWAFLATFSCSVKLFLSSLTAPEVFLLG